MTQKTFSHLNEIKVMLLLLLLLLLLLILLVLLLQSNSITQISEIFCYFKTQKAIVLGLKFSFEEIKN